MAKTASKKALRHGAVTVALTVLLDISHFAYLNHETHKVVHYLYTYYRKDKDVIKRLEQMLEEMYQINEGN